MCAAFYTLLSGGAVASKAMIPFRRSPYFPRRIVCHVRRRFWQGWWRILAAIALPDILLRLVSAQQMRGSALEGKCAGLGLPPKESRQYDFYLGLALAKAAETGRTGCLHGILDLSDPPVDVGVEDAAGLTALAHSAARGDMPEIKRILPRADIKCARWACHAPLALASFEGHLEVVAALLVSRAGVDGRNEDGRTPLQLASLAGHRDVAEALLRHGAAPNAAAAEDGRAALHRAASRGHTEVVELLLRHGADSSALDAWGHTAYDLARQQEHRDVATRLARPIGTNTGSADSFPVTSSELSAERAKLREMEMRMHVHEEA